MRGECFGRRQTIVTMLADGRDDPRNNEEWNRRDHDDSKRRPHEQPVTGSRPTLLGRVMFEQHHIFVVCFPDEIEQVADKRQRTRSESIALKIMRSCTTRGMPRSCACQRIPIANSGDTRSPIPGSKPRNGSRPTRYRVLSHEGRIEEPREPAKGKEPLRLAGVMERTLTD